MRLIWYSVAWDDYVSWQQEDKKTLKRVNALIRDTLRAPFEGIGKPEPLKADLSGFGVVVLMTRIAWSIE